VASLRLGRFPAKAAVNIYMDAMKGRWRGRTTIQEEERKLLWIARLLEKMEKDHEIASTDPRHLSNKDIQLFLLKLADKDPDSQRRYISRMNSFLKFFENYTIEKMISKGFTMPRCAHKNIRVIETPDVAALFRGAMALQGWHGSINRGMMALYFATGARPSELRLAEFEDLDLKHERIFIRVPKGIGSWASAEWRDIIRPDMMPLIRRYVQEREAHLKGCGIKESKFLFPNTYRGMNSFYSANTWWEIKDELVKATDIKFRIKDWRSTITSITVNEDLSRLPDMSVQLGHANIGTTQKFYANIDRSRAGKKLKSYYVESGSIVPKMPVIDCPKNEDWVAVDGGGTGHIRLSKPDKPF